MLVPQTRLPLPLALSCHSYPVKSVTYSFIDLMYVDSQDWEKKELLNLTISLKQMWQQFDTFDKSDTLAVTEWIIFTTLAVARMMRQLTVPKCDGPILLLLDVLTCCVGTLSLKAWGQAGLLPHYPRVQLLCRRGIDPPAVTVFPVVYSSRAMAAVTADVSRSRSVTYSGVFAWGNGTLLSQGCSIDNFVGPDYLRPPCRAGIRLSVISVHATLFNQAHQSMWLFPAIVTKLTAKANDIELNSNLISSYLFYNFTIIFVRSHLIKLNA